MQNVLERVHKNWNSVTENIKDLHVTRSDVIYTSLIFYDAENKNARS